MGSLFTLTGAPAWACAALAFTYFGLITVLACTATFARSPARRRAALAVLQLLWVKRGPASSAAARGSSRRRLRSATSPDSADPPGLEDTR